MRPQMTKQDPRQRVKNFASVALGLTQEQAVREAQRCLRCKQPVCVRGCPVEVDIPSFIEKIAQKEFSRAAEKIKEKNNLPAICGRVCPQETQCEALCVLGKKGGPIAIGALERFAADWHIEQAAGSLPATKKRKAERIAVIGSGPSGLTCAADLGTIGYNVTIFESLHKPGGVLTYGIPEFRLPKKIVATEIENIQGLGVQIQLDVLIGKTLGLTELLSQGYSAIFIAAGAGLPQFLGIPGENLGRVYSANEFLTRVNLMKAYLFPEYDTPINIGRRVAVIGAGNVAFDAARCALRLGAEDVFIVYRRSAKEMPARYEEIENAKEEGVQLLLLTLPVRILADERGYVKAMECLKMKLGKEDASGRAKPLPIEHSEFNLEADTVIIAIGQKPNPLIQKTCTELTTTKDGIIVVDKETQATNLKGVYAGGDITTGAATVISAMGAGKCAAKAIDRYIRAGQL